MLINRFYKSFQASFCAWTVAIYVLSAAGAHADTIKIGGTGTGLGAMKWMAQAFNKSRSDAKLIVTPSLTGGIRAVIAGAVDIGISSRPANPEEESQGASTQAYASTPFVIATGAKNQGAGLSLVQLAEIYSGKLTRWPDGSPIRLVIRPSNDADTIALRALSAEMDHAISAALARKGLRIASTDQDNADALETLPGALGTTTLTLILTENRAITPLALDGAAPTLQSLATGRYPHFRTLYLVTGRNLSPLAKDFIAFIRSPAGQVVLVNGGNLALLQ